MQKGCFRKRNPFQRSVYVKNVHYVPLQNIQRVTTKVTELSVHLHNARVFL